MSKINFTKEHQERLNTLAGEALIKGTIFKAPLGGEVTIHDLFHNLAIGTLKAFNKTLKKQIEDAEPDEWTTSDYSDRKIADLKKRQELVFLIIGYKSSESERAAIRAQLAETKRELETLKESTKTPQDRILETEKKMAELEATLN